MRLAIVLALALIPLHAQWRLIWSDEFNGGANTPPDTSKWAYDLGDGGWGNKELEVYTNSVENVFQDGNGNLVIRAVQSADGGFTSGRIKTQGKFSVEYGRIEARIKIPFGQGIWPAFWMLGTNIDQVGWPNCGEIDVMENIGKEPGLIHGTVHGPGYAGSSPLTSKVGLASGARFADDYHVYAVEWGRDRVAFLLDGREYYIATARELPAGTQWVFDHPFFLLLNVAVGGTWPGNPDGGSVFPQTMLVDWVRVWQFTPERREHAP